MSFNRNVRKALRNLEDIDKALEDEETRLNSVVAELNQQANESRAALQTIERPVTPESIKKSNALGTLSKLIDSINRLKAFGESKLKHTQNIAVISGIASEELQKFLEKLRTGNFENIESASIVFETTIRNFLAGMKRIIAEQKKFAKFVAQF